VSTYDPGRYLRYEEMTAQLVSWAEAYPDLCRLEEIGRSEQGRSVWAMVLTNRATGADGDKPGYLIDANVHAGELTAGAAAMYAIDWLLTHYGSDPVARAVLDTRAFYAIPRVAVDGVEFFLTTPHLLRSSPKRYPAAEEAPGLYPEDVNGDGHILQMRMVHPDGDWKADPQDPRILLRRRPEDRDGGPYYRVFAEGLIRGWDGKGIPPIQRPWGLDFNRNYPGFWHPEGRQPGAGPYPLSEPETRAVASFLVSHPNIGGYVSLHTTGCVLLRPPSGGGDEKLDPADVESFKRMGEVCTRLTGYACKSTHEAFSYPGQQSLVKGADDWAYEHYGVHAFTCELWSVDVRAGARSYSKVGVKGLLALSDEEILEDERKLMAWNDRELGGQGFIPWKPHVHPQIGAVEIGGWDMKRCLTNAPEGPLLVEETSKVAAFFFQHALALPQLEVAVSAEEIGRGLLKVSARVRNAGGLCTAVTQAAVRLKTARPVEVRLLLGAQGVRLVSGQPTQQVEHLDGWLGATGRPGVSEAWVDWVVQAEPGAVLTVTACTPRAGRAVAELSV